MFKIGGQLFTAEGPPAVEKIASLGRGVFLDLKFHDTPRTVAAAVAAGCSLPGVALLNVHALGGLTMMQAAAGASRVSAAGTAGGGSARPQVIAVTILTSLDAAALRRVGILGPPKKRAAGLAQLARKAGLDGVLASGHEVGAIRRACGKEFLIVVPGVRPARKASGVRGDDQARVARPAEAILSGADYIVVGRPITAAADPRAAAEAIVEEIAHALRAEFDDSRSLR